MKWSTQFFKLRYPEGTNIKPVLTVHLRHMCKALLDKNQSYNHHRISKFYFAWNIVQVKQITCLIISNTFASKNIVSYGFQLHELVNTTLLPHVYIWEITTLLFKLDTSAHILWLGSNIAGNSVILIHKFLKYLAVTNKVTFRC